MPGRLPGGGASHKPWGSWDSSLSLSLLSSFSTQPHKEIWPLTSQPCSWICNLQSWSKSRGSRIQVEGAWSRKNFYWVLSSSTEASYFSTPPSSSEAQVSQLRLEVTRLAQVHTQWMVDRVPNPSLSASQGCTPALLGHLTPQVKGSLMQHLSGKGPVQRERYNGRNGLTLLVHLGIQRQMIRKKTSVMFTLFSLLLR